MHIPGYTILRELGRGGMGVVYQARHEELGREVAVKVILERGADPEALLRFVREGELLARAQHPNVVRVHELGRCPAGPFIVTELVGGEELEAWVRRGATDPRRAAELLLPLAEALSALHGQGVLHRDLKPANVIVRPDGSPALLDFGLAKDPGAESLTQSGVVLGTPAYMSPEQADAAKDMDERTDVYGLGAVLFALLAGARPFAEAHGVNLTVHVLTKEPAWPEAEGLEHVLRRSMAKEKAQRYPSAAHLASDLRAFLAGELEAPKDRRGLLLLAGLSLALILVTAGVWRWTRPAAAQATQSSRPPSAAPERAARTAHTRLDLNADLVELVPAARAWARQHGQHAPRLLESLRLRLAKRARSEAYWELSGDFMWGTFLEGGVPPRFVLVSRELVVTEHSPPVNPATGVRLRVTQKLEVICNVLKGPNSLYRPSRARGLERLGTESTTCAVPIPGGALLGTREGEIQIVMDGRQTTLATRLPTRVTALGQSPEGEVVVTNWGKMNVDKDEGTVPPKLYVFDAAGVPLASHDLAGSGTVVAFKDRLLAVGTTMGRVYLLDLDAPKAQLVAFEAPEIRAEGPRLMRAHAPAACRGVVLSVAFVGGRVYACSAGLSAYEGEALQHGGGGDLRAWEIKSKEEVRRRLQPEQANFLSASPDERWLLEGDSQKVRLHLLDPLGE